MPPQPNLKNYFLNLNFYVALADLELESSDLSLKSAKITDTSHPCQNALHTGKAVKEREWDSKRIRRPTHSRTLSCQVLPLTAREAKTWYPQSRGGKTWGLGTSFLAVLLSRGTSEQSLGSRDTCF